MTRFNKMGPSGERHRTGYRKETSPTPSQSMRPLADESPEVFEERRRNRETIEIMEAYNKQAAIKIEAGEEIEPRVMTYKIARKMIDDAIDRAKNKKPRG